MAKGQNVGKLYFGIDGDDKELKKKLKDLKLESVAIADIFKSIKLDTGGGKLAKDTQKAQLAADKLLTSNEKLVKSIHNTARAEEQLSNEKKKGSVIEEQRTLAIARRIVEEERKGYITAKNLREEIRAQQQAEMHALRVESANKRKANAGTKGQQDFKKSIDESNKSLSKQGDTLSSLEKKIIGVFSAHQLSRFAKEIINIRGQFQGLELGFETMLGSAEKSRKMMADITDMALKTPYSVKEVADNTKQLIAMGIEADKAIDTMKALADVSSGLAVPMWRIAINYGQVQTLGRLQQREIRDFAMAGVPIVEELAKQLGKTKSEITEMVQAGKIGFPMVEKAFMSMAGESGKFHNMTEKLNSTMLGQMNRLTDQIQLMFNAIGKSNEGVIYSAISGASTLVENYEKVGKAMLALVATYGTYKAILIGIRAVEQARVAIAITQIASTATLTATQTALTISTNVLSYAFGRLNKVISASPYLLAAAAIVGLGYGIYEISTASSSAEISLNALNNAIDSHVDYVNSLKDETNSLLSVLNSETEVYETQILKFNELKNLYPSVLSDIDLFTLKTMSATEQQKLFNKAIYEQGEVFKKKEITELENLLTKINSPATSTKEWGKAIEEARKILGVDGFLDHFSTLQGEIPDMLEKHITSLKGKLESSSKTIEENGDAFITYEEQVENAKNKVSKLKTELDSLQKGSKPINLKEGEQFDFAKGIESKSKELKEAEENLNWLLYGRKKETQRDFKDPLVTQLEKRIEIFKKAKTEFDKLSKSMDADSAFAKINQNPAFSSISQSELSTDGFISSIDKLISEASKLKVSDERDKLLANLFSLREETASKIAKEAMDAVERELNKYKDKYNLYETLFGISGDKDLAIKLSFGNIEGEFKSYADTLKDQMKLLPEMSDEYKKLNDELEKLENSKYAEAVKAGLQAIHDFSTTEQKIEAIKNKYKELREAASDPITGEVNQTVIEGLTKKEEDEISKLKEELFSLTDYYKAIFGDLSEVTFRGLKNMVAKGKSVIDSATASLDKDGKQKGYKVSLDGKDHEVSIQEFEKFRKKIVELDKDVKKQDPFSALSDSIKKLKSGEIDLETFAKSASVSLSNIMDIANDVGKSISDMLSALGNEDGADAINFALDLGNAFTQMTADLASGNPVQQVTGVVKGVSSVITSIAGYHDKKLDKAIKRSQLEVKKLQNIYRDLEFQINNAFDGNRFKRQGELISNLYTQQIQLQKQLQAEQKKKSKDKSAIEDYKEQIREIEREVHSVMQSIKDEVYGSVQENAANLGNALVNAFRQGEDAAKAWGDTVDDIVTNIVKQVAIQKYIEPKVAEAIKKYHEKATGATDAQREQTAKEVKDIQALIAYVNDLPKLAYKLKINGSVMSRSEAVAYLEAEKKRREEILESMNDPSLDKQGLKELEDELKDIFGGVEWLKDYLGIADSAKSTLSKGVKGITENQADLLASHANAIRADNAVSREQLILIAKLSQLNTNTLGNMLAELVAIRENTFNTANNTGDIVKVVTETNNIIKLVTTPNSGKRMNI